MSYFGFFADVISIFAAVTILVEIRQLKKCKCSECNCSSNVSELSSLASESEESESDGSISDCSESSDDSWPLDEKLLIRSESYPCFNLTNTELGNDVKLVRAKSFNMFS